MHFIIDESKWRCGGMSVIVNRNQETGEFIDVHDNPNHWGDGDTYLLNHLGYMCCLGQICKQMGVSDENLSSRATPQDILESDDKYPQLNGILLYSDLDSGHDIDSELSTSAMTINDDENLTHNERKGALVKLFEEHGHTIEFVKGVQE